MNSRLTKALLIVCAALLGACAGNGTRSAGRPASQVLISRRIDTVATLSVTNLSALLRENFSSQPALPAMIGAPKCAVTVYKFGVFA